MTLLGKGTPFLTEGEIRQSKGVGASDMKPSASPPTPRHFQLEKGLDKAKLNTLVNAYESSRKIITEMVDLDSVVNAKTTEMLLQQLTLLAKVLKAEGALREEFLNNLKKLGE
jgi:hypothetical protein